MRVPLDQIPEIWRMRVMDYAKMAGVSRREVYRRRQLGDRHEIVWAVGPSGMIIHGLKCKGISFDRVREWHRLEQPAKLPGSQTAPAPQPSATGQFQLLPQTESERALSDLKARLYRLNPTKYEAIEQRFRTIDPMTNHKFALEAPTKTAYAKVAARRVGPHGVSVQTVWRWYADFTRALKEGGIAPALQALAKNDPGPEKGTGALLDDSMKCIVTRLWLTGKTRKQCWEGMMCPGRDKRAAVLPV
jgi:hypothetical protein